MKTNQGNFIAIRAAAGRAIASRFVALAIFSLMSIVAAHASPIPFKSARVEYDLKGEPLKDFLAGFFADQGLQVVLSPLVENQGGTLNGPRSGTPEQVFRSIANANQLTAYYDGSAVYVYKQNERITRYFAVPPAKVQDFVRAFQGMHLGDAGNTFSARSDTGLVVATGAPRFVEQAQELTRTLKQQELSANAVFKMFELKYAWASDASFTVGNRQVTIPGVATILKQLMYAPEQANGSQGGSHDRVVKPVSMHLKGTGLAGIGADGQAQRTDLPVPLARPDDAYAAPPQAEQGADLSPGAYIPYQRDARIVADPYRNAVIVRDTPDSMPLYAELVRQLDVEPRIIQLEATIIDVDRRKLRDLGIDWRWRNGRTAVGFGTDRIDPVTGRTIQYQNDFLRALGLDSIDALAQRSPGLQIGGIVGDSYKFIARINALADDGVTNVVSRPQVITLNDTEAVMENTRTLYVPVNGAYEVDLFNVVAGTILRVTPHLVDENGRMRIRLLVSIEDGDVQISATNTSGAIVNYPTVTRAAINTQAIIDENQSLLLGGLVRNLSGKDVDKIPLLGDIPVLGNLFKREQKQRERTERLFLISPRLVPLNQIAEQTPNLNRPVTIGTLEQDSSLREKADKDIDRHRDDRVREIERQGTPVPPAPPPEQPPKP
ncbi:MAG TPA: type III secretion system outer membrane ring subunit SctC [Rhodanobacteraceae bacterium]|nr:type III secretion system outer membrane ring subunit SctC [Rhodanobacteraceae bacterium]